MPSGFALALPCLAKFLLISKVRCLLHKFRDTALKLRLVALDIGNYAVGLRACFALSCKISTNQQSAMLVT